MAAFNPFEFLREEYTSVSFQPTTLMYAHGMIAPYAQVLGQTEDPNILKQWVTNLPVSLQEQILEELGAQEQDAPQTGTDVRNFILEQLVLAILGEAQDFMIDQSRDVAVLPWDIVDFINSEYAPLFGIDTNKKTLPVTITIGPQQFQHEMTADQALGLVLFQKVSGANFHPMMFGVELDYFADPNEHGRFDVNDEATYPVYRVQAGDRQVQFRTPEFMQGFVTGATWAGVDHHTYWRNLQQLPAAGVEPIALNF